MKQLYKDRTVEGVGFSRNGYAAYLRGERPERLFAAGSCIVKDNYADMVIPAGTTPKVGVNFGSLSKFELGEQ